MITKKKLERRGQKVLSPPEFRRRLAGFVLVAGLVALGALAGGMLGYHHFEELSWTDSFLNASMILSGMGPVEQEFKSEGGKIFAGIYALFSGTVFLAVAGLVFAPLIHRLLHKFHFDEDQVEDLQDDGGSD